MNWLEIGNWAFQTLVPIALLLGSVSLIVYIGIKKKEIKDKTDSDTVDRYLDMLETTITDAVLTTTQTYVEALKNKNAFDIEAQKIAFKMSYDAVMKVLTDDAKLYLQTIVGDLQTYITNKIEAKVKLTKVM